MSTRGGLLRKADPIGATAAAQLVELTERLRGAAGDRQVAGAPIRLAESGGFPGSGATCAVVHIPEGAA